MSEPTETTTTDAPPKAETYKLTLKGGGLTVERDVDETTAFQILAALMGGAALPRVTGVTGGGSPAGEVPRTRTSVTGRLSLREHMDEFEPKRNPDKILAIAGYLADVREMETFTPDDVKKEFRHAAEPVPGNYARDWRWAVSNGWLAKADEPGEFYITIRGRDALSQKFSGDVKKATKQSGTTRRRRTAKKAEETS